jgi:hypothetical protein
MKNVIFWDVTPCNLLDVYRRFREMYCDYIQGRKANRAGKQSSYLLLLACSAYLSTLKMVAVCFFETPANFYHITRRHIPNAIIRPFSYEARPSQGNTTANHNRKFGVVFSLGPRLLLDCDTRRFCPEQFSADQCLHVLSFSQGKLVV